MSRRGYNQVARAEAEGRTRVALINAATRAFFEGDWQSTSLEGIATEAGVTKQTLLRHFGSRDGLARAAFELAKDEVGSQRAAAPAGDVTAAVENLLDHYEAFGDRALKLEALSPSDAGFEFLERGREMHYEWVERVFKPFLKRCTGRERARRLAALIAICDVHTWRLLSRHLGLARPEIRATLLIAIHGVLEEHE